MRFLTLSHTVLVTQLGHHLSPACGPSASFRRKGAGGPCSLNAFVSVHQQRLCTPLALFVMFINYSSAVIAVLYND